MNLFQKSIEPHCAYCALGKALSDMISHVISA